MDSMFSVFKKSLIGFKFCPSVLFWSSKRVLCYFLSLTGIMSFVMLWIQLPILILGMTELTDWAVRKLPSFRFEKGELQMIGEPKRYVFPLEKDFPFLGDSFTLAIDSKDLIDATAITNGILLEKTRAVLKSGKLSRVFEYPKTLSVTVSPYTLMHGRDVGVWVMPIYLWIRSFFYLVFYKGLEVFFLGGMGFLIGRFLKKPIEWSSCVYIAVIALGPALVFAFILGMFDAMALSINTIYYVLYLFFYLGLFKACLRADSIGDGCGGEQ